MSLAVDMVVLRGLEGGVKVVVWRNAGNVCVKVVGGR